MRHINGFKSHLPSLVGLFVFILMTCGLAAPAYSQGGQALIAPGCLPGLGGQFSAPGGPVEIKILPFSADFTDQIILFSPGPARPIATNRDVGKVVNLGSFPAGTELVFGIFVRNTGQVFKMGSSGRNPDGQAHAIVECSGSSNATVRFEDLLGGGDNDFNDTVFSIEPAPTSSPTRTPPFDFADCNQTKEFGDSNASAKSNALSGALDLRVRATAVGSASGQAGAGVIYTPDFSGPAKIRAAVRITAASFDLVYVIGGFTVKVKDFGDIDIPKFGIASLESSLFLTADTDPHPDTALSKFRAEIITPLTGGKNDVVFVPFSFTRHDYFPEEVFYVELNTTVERNQPLRICAGVTSKATVATPIKLQSVAEARYIARLLDIQVERRVLIARLDK